MNDELPVFRPDDAEDFFHPFEELYACLDILRNKVDAWIKRGYVPRVALFRAYCDLFRPPGGFAVGFELGAKGFYKSLARRIEQARTRVKLVAGKLPGYSKQLALHNSVRNALDPYELLLMATEPERNDDPSSIENRGIFEARRAFCIALQLLMIEHTDPERGVSHDLKKIDRLSWKRLFKGGLNVWVAADLTKRGRRVKGNPFYFRTEPELEAHLRAKRRERPTPLLHHEPTYWPCRLAPVNGHTYVVYVEDRGKEAPDVLLRLERYHRDDQPIIMKDRRGWKYVLLGTLQDGGILPASKRDVREFLDYTVNRLWIYPLEEELDTDHLNQFRHDGYWDLKVVGRFVRKASGGRHFSGRCEQLVTSGKNHLTIGLTTGKESHDLYRLEQLVKVLCPLWWPTKRYGVEWNDDTLRSLLKKVRASL